LKTYPLPSVDSQVIFQSYQPLGGMKIYDFIVEAAASIGFPAEACNLLKTSTEHDVRVLCGKFHILVTQTVPFETSLQLDLALDTFTVKSGFPEAAGIFQTAKAYTQISVQKGVLPHAAMPEGLLKAVGPEMTAFCESKETSDALALAAKVTDLVVKNTHPDAVFWGQSFYCMKPETFEQIHASGKPLQLYLQPVLHGDIDPETGKQLIGVIGSGAPCLIGYSVEIRPCSLPPEYLISTLYSFVAFTQKSGKLIDNEDVFGASEEEKVQVLYHGTPEDKPDVIELKVVQNTKFGIFREPVPTIQKQYDDDCNLVDERIANVEQSALNPDDPIDAAILERLTALKSQDLADRTVPEQQPANAEESIAPPAVEPSIRAPDRDSRSGKMPAQRVSMEELRKFAMRSQVEDPQESGTIKKRGFFGSLFGKKLH